MTEAPPSRRALLAAVRQRLAAAGIADPGREARWLWARASREPLERTVVREEESAAPEALEAMERLLARRAAGEPLAYVLGETDFRHLTLGCDRRALIPRPETEGVVDLAIARQNSGCAVDVGTGTGCLALSLAREGHFRSVTGLDTSAGALALAAANAARLSLPVRLVRGDLVSALAPGSVDLLVSNPPYLSLAEYGALDPGVRDWEPAAALVSGEDGMEASRRLFYEGRRVVRPGGTLVAELDAARARDAGRLATEAGWAGVTVLDDLFGRPRYLVARRDEEC